LERRVAARLIENLSSLQLADVLHGDALAGLGLLPIRLAHGYVHDLHAVLELALELLTGALRGPLDVRR
jgi:hypothetical protein